MRRYNGQKDKSGQYYYDWSLETGWQPKHSHDPQFQLLIGRHSLKCHFHCSKQSNKNSLSILAFELKPKRISS
jgi:hypothetical protein